VNTRYESHLWAREAERPFIRRVSDWVTRVQQHASWHLTDFLTPREQHLLSSFVQSKDVCVEFYGGHTLAERKRALIMPDMWYPAAEDFHIATVRIEAPSGAALSHGSILGAVLGTGLDRRKTGDIWSANGYSFVMVAEDVVNFLRSEWTSVGREPIFVDMVESGMAYQPPQYEPKDITVASMRIDAIVAHACHFSRSAAQAAVERGLVSLNHAETLKPDVDVQVGDIISVRGFGRIKIIAIPGKTKKDRLRIQVGVLHSSRR
jgi:RNA-binding protein YlmH